MIDGIANQVEAPKQEIVEMVKTSANIPGDIPNIPSIEKPLEDNPAIPMPKPKQYLLMADELHMALLAKLMPGLHFVLVEGMPLLDNPNYMLLANPKPQPNVIPQETSPIVPQ
jgi:hypothetical protein